MKSLPCSGALRPRLRFPQTILRFFLLSILTAGFTLSAQALDYYWVGGSGLWSDHNNHWATSSGGNVFHDQVPQSMDNVYFDANSGFSAGDTVVIDPTIIYCMDMDWTGVGNMPVFLCPSDKQIWIYGSLKLIPEMEWKVFGEVHFRAFQMGKLITSAGHSFVSTVYFEGFGGEWMLQDVFETGSSVYHYNGTLRTNSNTLNIGGHWNYPYPNFYGTPEFYLGSSTMHFKGQQFDKVGYFHFYGPTALDADESHIVYDSTSYGYGHLYDNGHNFLNVTFKGGYYSASASGCNILGKLLFESSGQYSGNQNYVHEVEFCLTGGFNASNTEVDNALFKSHGSFGGSNNVAHNVVFKGPGSIFSNDNQAFGEVVFEDDGSLSGNNTYDTLTFSPGKIYRLQNGATQTINTGGLFNSSSTGCDNFITILATQSGGGQAKFYKTGPDVDLEYVTVMDIAVEGGATFNAINGVDLGNNMGWTFMPIASRDLYWVGGKGEWMDKNHWSSSSGGPGGECIPTAYDDVFFDANSGFSPDDTVTLNQSIAYCRDMDWTGVANTPVMRNLSGGENLNVYGSLTFVPGMINYFYGEYHFRAMDPGHTISCGGQLLRGAVYFEGIGGEWTLQDEFETGSSVYHYNGTLRTNNNTLQISGHWNYPYPNFYGTP